ncbi:MAG TPA: NIPSNAP family protein [Dehalococcoidia bacterium]|nr:NIPSNAP family protein [Dehalococcoidia bacterium]
MQAQVRIYTINKGEMDAFLKHFREEVLPLHESIGWPVVATWVNRPQNEFVWIRTYSDAADLEAKTKAFQEGRAARNITLGAHVAKMEVREVEEAFVPAVTA